MVRWYLPYHHRNMLTPSFRRKYKSSAFKPQLLAVLHALSVPLWQESELTPDLIKISKVSGSLTNAVFFVSCPSEPLIPTLLLRIYGSSSGALISRPRELHTLHILSSRYRIGPRVYGTFGNGRIEEYFDSVTLVASDLRDENISRWIGARMAELHCVDIEAIEETSPVSRGEGKGWEIGAKKNVKAWLAPAREVLALPAVTETSRRDLDLDVFMQRWEKYMRWLKEFEKTEGASRRVFAHNDAQYGNLLRLAKIKEGLPEHHQVCKTRVSWGPYLTRCLLRSSLWISNMHHPTLLLLISRTISMNGRRTTTLQLRTLWILLVTLRPRNAAISISRI